MTLHYMAQTLKLLVQSTGSHWRAPTMQWVLHKYPGVCITTYVVVSILNFVHFLSRMISCSSISIPSCTRIFAMNLGPVVKVMASSCFAYILQVLVMHASIMIYFNVNFLIGFCLDVFKNTPWPDCTCLQEKSALKQKKMNWTPPVPLATIAVSWQHTAIHAT